MKLLETILDAKREIYDITNIDLMRNYLYRELLTEEVVSKFDNTYHNTTLDHLGSHGDDFENSRTNRGEDKSSQNVKVVKRGSGKGLLNINSCQFQFDKCDDIIKQEKMLDVKSYTFGFYDKSDKLHFVAYINTDAGVKYMNGKIKDKISQLMEKVVDCAAKNKRLTRDCISIFGPEIISCPEVIFIDKNGVISNIKEKVLC